MRDAIYCTMIRNGRTTFFVDVIKPRDRAKVLKITESRIDKDEKKARVVLTVPIEATEQFKLAITEAIACMNASL